MRIRFRTNVLGDYRKVFEAFDQKLFEYLKPPNQLAELVRFDGSAKGDMVHLRFRFPFKSHWVSEIVENYVGENRCHFIDEGRKLPFGLRSWRHEHIVHNAGEDSIIEDNINFDAKSGVAGFLIYPALWITFFIRKWQYKKFFSSTQK